MTETAAAAGTAMRTANYVFSVISIVLGIALVLFMLSQTTNLLNIGNAIGKGVREFRKASNDLEESIRGDTKKPSSPPPAPAAPAARIPPRR